MSGERCMAARWVRVTGVVTALAVTVGGTAGPAFARARGERVSPAVAGAVAAGTISTVAGGVGGPGKGTAVGLGGAFSDPCGVSYSSGYLFIADAYTLRKVSQATDALTTPAGTGGTSPAGNGGPAASAALESCAAVKDASSGNLVISDQLNNQVRVMAAKTGTYYGQAMTAGDIYTIAGDGTAGYTGDGGPAVSAELKQPAGLVLDGSGNVVVADAGNQRVRVVAAKTGTYYGQAMTAGDIYTIAGDGTAGYAGDRGPAVKAELDYSTSEDGLVLNQDGLAVDGTGNLLISDPANNRVRVVAAKTGTYYGQKMTAGDIYTIAGNGTAGYTGNAAPAVKAELDTPRGLALDSAGNVLIADETNNRVRVVAAKTGTYYGQKMTAGDIYAVAGDGTSGFSGNGGSAVKAELSLPNGVTVDGAGNLVIADTVNHQVRVVAAKTGTYYGQAMTAGDIYTIAGTGTGGGDLGCFSGDDGAALKAELCSPSAVAVDAAGNLVIADSLNARVRVVAAATGTFYGQAMTAGDIYTIAGGGSSSGNGVPATEAAFVPYGLAIDGAGNLVMAVNTEQVRVVAATTGTFYGQAMTAGDIYTIAGTGAYGFSGDGGPAVKALLEQPEGVALDSAGNVVIDDAANDRVRVVAATTGMYYGQAMTAGDIYTIAGGGNDVVNGGPATSAYLSFPEAVAIDPAGNLVIADTGHEQIRVVAASTGSFYGQAMTAGDIYTIAGTGRFGSSGDGGPATEAELTTPDGLVVDSAGNVLITDTGNFRVQAVAATAGTFYGQAMTAGDMYTVAGDRTGGFSGDGGPATSAELSLEEPDGLAVDQAGNLLIADANNNRIREVTN